MESNALLSARAKIGRAQSHFEAITEALQLVWATKFELDTIGTKLDSDSQEIVLTMPKSAPLDPAFPLLIGDCVHNLRSALDHLVYQLAVLNDASPDAASKTFFPICIDPKDFKNKTKKLVKPYISDNAFAEIERCQPYAAYDIPEQADIWILHKVDIIDKHRLLLVARQKFAATGFTVTIPNRPPMQQIITDPKWKPMEDGAEILRFQLTDSSRPAKVQMKTQLGRTVEFVDTELVCDGMPIVPVLAQQMALVGAIVQDFGKVFFGE